MATRSETSTVKVPTSFGNQFVHVDHVEGNIIDVRVSSPGKFLNTELSKMLEDMGDAIGREIRDVRARWGKS